jgi:hypothetical protein
LSFVDSSVFISGLLGKLPHCLGQNVSCPVHWFGGNKEVSVSVGVAALSPWQLPANLPAN